MRIARVISLITILVVANGCLSYQSGSLMHPQLNSIAISEFENRTVEPRLNYMVQRSLAEDFMTDGSLTLFSSAKADAIIQGRILDVDTHQIAATKARDEEEREADRDAYQPAVFRMEITVAYRVTLSKREEPLLQGEVAGNSDFSQLPDLHIAREEALQRAVNDATSKITAAVTEAW